MNMTVLMGAMADPIPLALLAILFVSILAIIVSGISASKQPYKLVAEGVYDHVNNQKTPNVLFGWDEFATIHFIDGTICDLGERGKEIHVPIEKGTKIKVLKQSFQMGSKYLDCSLDLFTIETPDGKRTQI